MIMCNKVERVTCRGHLEVESENHQYLICIHGEVKEHLGMILTCSYS